LYVPLLFSQGEQCNLSILKFLNIKNNGKLLYNSTNYIISGNSDCQKVDEDEAFYVNFISFLSPDSNEQLTNSKPRRSRN
jgi:hypothetical protein